MKRVLFTAVLVFTSVAISQGEDYVPVRTGFLSLERIVAPQATSAPAPADDLPPAASALIKTFEGESEQIRARIEAEIAVKREALVQQLQAMQDGYTREAKLDEAVAIRDTIRKLRRSGLTVLSDPGWLTSYRGQIEKVLHFEVVGNIDGSVYGTDIYTDDSDLSTAAVHAGVLKPGEKGVVKVTILPSQASYISTTRNGVTSTAWSQYPGSYKIEALPGGSRSVTTTALADPGSLWNYEKHVGKSFEFQVTGSTSGTIWGTGVYTGDSKLSVAAVHAGVLRDGESGVVKVTIMPGDSRYLGSSRNGVSSYDYNSYPFSYRVDPVISATRRVYPASRRLLFLNSDESRIPAAIPGLPPASSAVPRFEVIDGESIEGGIAQPVLGPTPLSIPRLDAAPQ